MDKELLSGTVKQIISHVTGIDPSQIADSASFVDDLGLDSLSIIEIAVEVEYQFKFKPTDDEVEAIRTVNDTVHLIQHYLSLKKI